MGICGGGESWVDGDGFYGGILITVDFFFLIVAISGLVRKWV